MSIKIGYLCMPDGTIKTVAMEKSEGESDIDQRFMTEKRIQRRLGLRLNSGKMSTLGKGKKCSPIAEFWGK